MYKTTDAQRDKYLKRRHPCEMSLDVTFRGRRVCLCVCVLVSGWSLNEKFGLEFKLPCREQNGVQDKKKKKDILVEREKKNHKHVVPVQERHESFLAVLLRGCVPAVLFMDLNQGFVGLLCSGEIVLVFIGSKLHSGFSFD